MHDFFGSFETGNDSRSEKTNQTTNQYTTSGTSGSFSNTSIDDFLLAHHSEVEEVNDFSSPDSTSFMLLDNQQSNFEFQHQIPEHQDLTSNIDEFLEF